MVAGYMLLQAAALATAPDAGSDIADLLSGTFSNEEQVYFEKDAGRAAPPWLSLRISRNKDGLTLEPIDAYGEAIGATKPVVISAGEARSTVRVGSCSRYFERTGEGWRYGAVQNRMACKQDYQIIAVNPDGVRLRLNDGSETSLKRARPVQCWAAIPKADGSTDWVFAGDLALHDQGGRARVGGGDSGAEAVTLRMRAVHWPAPSRNRPSMVLYVHKQDPDRAESYSWADIDASRVGLNLRWMQASCTIPGAERPSGPGAD
ncbi:hypothetical protein C8024_09465 [Sphingopyxis sp. BSNA05]|uniref:hypothetical protein n=1 Tax=Sphingopyxis sp. BSNA05 TaxID=1236614 RepID=UPI0015636576|nr:hypothetical protein [Sphingopyxis sp. BSNA05]NRD89628.1 hypothetical protein [Sphingopyxis sp. BSNA05]